MKKRLKFRKKKWNCKKKWHLVKNDILKKKMKFWKKKWNFKFWKNKRWKNDILKKNEISNFEKMKVGNNWNFSKKNGVLKKKVKNLVKKYQFNKKIFLFELIIQNYI